MLFQLPERGIGDTSWSASLKKQWTNLILAYVDQCVGVLPDRLQDEANAAKASLTR
jgi:hypothetical protein